MTFDETDKMEEGLRAVGESKARMAPREREFITDLETRFDEQKSSMRMSGRQWSWFITIVEKYS